MQQQQATTRQSSLSKATYKPAIRRLGTHGLFRVQSATSPQTWYIVDSVDQTCTCPNGQHGRGQCWHLKACAGMTVVAPAVIYPGEGLQQVFGVA